ncbi:hypothetical protein DPMN_070314 [Dreissena polymorpha]|uniref:Uncharacterized protein n=1 Tax=Dreissena polymorpha TaxID=45954 RepID=A0A9D3Z5Y7_DREPO|nr:hypothetical protein DPMN_070314 [Dreissena polymorpha]
MDGQRQYCIPPPLAGVINSKNISSNQEIPTTYLSIVCTVKADILLFLTTARAVPVTLALGGAVLADVSKMAVACVWFHACPMHACLVANRVTDAPAVAEMCKA